MDTNKGRSPITGIRIKDALWQQIEQYHHDHYPNEKFVISQVILELINKGLGNDVTQSIKHDVKSTKESVNRDEFERLKSETLQAIHLLNNKLNQVLNTELNQDNTLLNTELNQVLNTELNQDNTLLNTELNQVLNTELNQDNIIDIQSVDSDIQLSDSDIQSVDSDIHLPDTDIHSVGIDDRSYQAAIAMAKKMLTQNYLIKDIEKYLTENKYLGKKGEPANWSTRLPKIPEIKEFRESLINGKN
jgi:hypothetical protein